MPAIAGATVKATPSKAIPHTAIHNRDFITAPPWVKVIRLPLERDEQVANARLCF